MQSDGDRDPEMICRVLWGHGEGGRSARLGGLRGSILVKVTPEVRYKRQIGFSWAITGSWRVTL